MKKYMLGLTVAIIVLLGSNAMAQDVIHMKNGKTINAVVKEITHSTISYHLEGSEQRLYKIIKQDVKKIEYENGEVETFSRAGSEIYKSDGRAVNGRYSGEPKPSDYGNNIVSLFPVFINNHGIGVGLNYERILDKKGYFSVELPISYTFVEPFSNNNEKIGVLGLYPTFKFFPTGNRGKARYAIGATLGYTSGSRKYEDFIFTPGGVQQFQTVTEDIERVGVMLDNSANFFPTTHMHIGLNLGLGYLISAEPNYNLNQSTDVPMVRFGVKFGYRF